MERLEEIKQIYKDLDINDSGYGNNMPDNELKTNFPTRFKNIDITTTCLLAK